MEGHFDSSSPEVEFINRIRKLLRDLTELEHRIGILYTKLEKRRRLIEILEELVNPEKGSF